MMIQITSSTLPSSLRQEGKGEGQVAGVEIDPTVEIRQTLQILPFLSRPRVLHLLPFTFSCYALDEGGGTAGIEYRRIDQEASSFKNDEYEATYHLDLWQNLPNVGKLSLWLDWVTGNNSTDFNRLGRGYLSLDGFRLNDFTLNGRIGDSSFQFTNLPEKFTNVIYPDIYFRGGQVDLFSKWGEVHLYGGKVAILEGLLGNIYNITDESLYGFKGSLRPFPQLLLGTGYIRTTDEVNSADRPVTKSNNIFLFDSDLQIFKEVKWLTEFLGSDFTGELGTESHKDYLIRLGPIIRTEKFRLEANFRRIGTNYHFVNDITQADRDQQGLFLLAEYRPWKELSLFGNADLFNDNVADYSIRNTTTNLRGLIGGSFFSPPYPSLYVTYDVIGQKTRFDFPSPVNNLTSTLYSEVRYQYKDFNPYARYRWVNFKDDINKTNEYNQNILTLGLRQIFKMGSTLYVEGQVDQKDFQTGGQESQIAGRVGFNYYYSPKFSCWGEAPYGKLKDRDEGTHRNAIEGAFGLNDELPWGIQLYADARYAKTLQPERDILKAQGFQATFRILKKFSWGKREKIAGLRPGAVEKGYGSIEGLVFNDINRNGVRDRGEEGIKDVTIRLEDGSTVKTDEKGFYQFPRVEEGSHLITLDVKRIPAEYSIVSPEKVKVEIKLRETVRVSFQLIAVGRIEGQIINDLNSNGKIDPGEKGIPDVLVLLEPGDNNAYTDEDGRFIFENILPGEYQLKIDPATLPADSVFTSPSELRFQIRVGEEVKGTNFFLHVKPRPIIFGPPKQ